jgi:hypothetical protein
MAPSSSPAASKSASMAVVSVAPPASAADSSASSVAIVQTLVPISGARTKRLSTLPKQAVVSRTARITPSKRKKQDVSDEDPTPGDASVRPVTDIERKCIEKMVLYYYSNPDCILEKYALLTSETTIVKDRNPDEWNSTYVFWRQISKNWLSNLICELGSNHGITTEIMDDIDGDNTDTVREMCTLFFGIKPGEKFPRPLLHKPVMRSYLIWRGSLFGNRWKTFISMGAYIGMGKVDFRKSSPFQFKWNGIKVDKISHDVIQTIVDVSAAKVDIDKTWQSVAPYDELGAQIVSSMFKPLLFDFFDSELVKVYIEQRYGETIMVEKAKELKKQYMEGLKNARALEQTTLTKQADKQKMQRQERAKKNKPGLRPVVCMSLAP